MVYWIIISVIGSALLFFLGILSMAGSEALRLPKDEQVSRGLMLFLSAIVRFI